VPMEQAPSPVEAATIPCQYQEKFIAYKYDPAPISWTYPEYPQEARARKESGTVWCHVFVDTTGVVAQAHVMRQLTPSLDEAALRAARATKSTPARRDDGSKVAVWKAISMTFSLPDSSNTGGRPLR